MEWSSCPLLLPLNNMVESSCKVSEDRFTPSFWRAVQGSPTWTYHHGFTITILSFFGAVNHFSFFITRNTTSQYSRAGNCESLNFWYVLHDYLPEMMRQFSPHTNVLKCAFPYTLTNTGSICHYLFQFFNFWSGGLLMRSCICKYLRAYQSPGILACP